MPINRRKVLISAAAVAFPVILPTDIKADGFIPLADDGEFMTCPLPRAETVVEVKLRDGTVMRSMYDCNIAEAGDWDFSTVTADDDYGDESIADRVVAWRPLA